MDETFDRKIQIIGKISHHIQESADTVELTEWEKSADGRIRPLVPPQLEILVIHGEGKMIWVLRDEPRFAPSPGSWLLGSTEG